MVSSGGEYLKKVNDDHYTCGAPQAGHIRRSRKQTFYRARL